MLKIRVNQTSKIALLRSLQYMPLACTHEHVVIKNQRKKKTEKKFQSFDWIGFKLNDFYSTIFLSRFFFCQSFEEIFV